MPAIRAYLFDRRLMGVLGLAALAVFLFLGASALEVALVYAAIAIGVALCIWFVVWIVRGVRARRAARGLEEALDEEAARAQRQAPAQRKGELGALRERLQQAVKTIKTSRLGQSTGSAALYELPWYMVIGNPAAGKSTAVVKSGLKFPFADNDGSQVIQGIGGTRNCDWFFTSEGILLDTAGRYAVHEEDRGEWLDFLALLKKHRSKAPINGILIAASVAELSQVRPEAAIQLAKNLRQRVQELTERLEVFAPVYLVFTKADLIAGFAEFFEDRDRSERDRAWGATLPYEPGARVDAVALFDQHFDELHAGLKELATARMSLHRGQALPPGVLTFPLEFAALKPALRSFVTTLFEDNPYQFRPVFRGFYFTSAVQEGTASSRASDEVAEQFALSARPEHTTARIVAENGLFLKDLFSKVIFADRHLVKQHASRAKVRARGITFAVAVALLAVALGGWSWSYLGNRQLISNVRADLDKAVKLQEDRVDLASRLEALELLQDRIAQLQRYRDARPLSVGLGLFQGEAIERKLRDEYFNGVRQVMLRPVAQALQEFLADVNLNADKLQPMTHTPESGAAPANARAAHTGGRFSEASPASVEDAYNALKTYLMLAERERMETGHLTDQITRFWRGWLEDNRGTMPREQMIRSAERMISFALANLQDPAFPIIDANLGTVDQTRMNLRRVVRGMPARERVYAEVKARASTRFAPVTVARIVGQSAGKGTHDSVTGSYAVSGAFTREGWNGFIESAFKQAADNELQTVDWVLKTSARDDLSLEGSPEQIRKALTDLYKTEYVREWQRFMQGISVADFRNFESAVQHMNLLGDTANSPIKKLMTTLFEQTSWDNPTLLNERMAHTQRGFLDWFRQTILRQNRTGVTLDVNVTADKPEVPMGPVGREFAALGRLMMSRDSGPTVLAGYLQALGKVRSRFNQIKTQGDPGPASRQLMATTLEGTGSELSDALKFVDEQMLVGMSDSARATLRPLLVRPLIQSFAVVVQPAETEINRVWAAQVLEPYQRNLAGKYPFDTNSKVEAGAKDIAKVFGPEGAVARFSNDALGALVVRRGNSVTPRTWADLGVRLRPEFGQGFAGWVSPLEGAAAGTGGSSGGEPVSQWTFQVLPQGAPGLIEYTVQIDGQSLRYRNTAASWQDFVWPNVSVSPGVRITGVTNDGRSVVVFEAAGQNGLTRAIEAAKQRKMSDDSNELTWANDGVYVSVQLRVVSQPGAATGGNADSGRSSVAASDLRGVHLPALVVGADAPPLPAASVAAASTGAAQ